MPVAQNSLNINSTGVVAYNSTTGVFTESAITDHYALVGGTSNAITSVNPSTAGFILTSNGPGVDPSFQVAPATGGFVWVDVTSTPQTVASPTGYITNFATQVTYVLPATPTLGDIFRVTGGTSASATAPWIITQNATQQIKYGNQATTVGTGGSIAATLQYDGIEMVCVTGGSAAVWTVISSLGSLIVT